MTSSRRPLVSGKVRSFSRTICFQSGMAHLHDAVDGAGEGAPARALLGENFAARVSEAVVPAAPTTGGLPLAFDPAAAFEAVEQRIKRSDVKAEDAFGALGDELADFVAVAGLVLEQGEDEKLGVAFFEFAVRCECHICLYYILAKRKQALPSAAVLNQCLLLVARLP